MFFGEGEARLFGVHHTPAAQPRDRAVLLCGPGPQEANGAHRAFRKLASLLAARGFHALRFDWRCTGDSAGASADADLDRWVDDVRTAARELADLAGVRGLSIVGMRLGAAVALRACAAGVRARDIVLWEPVVRGAEYLDELEALDRRRNITLMHARSEGAAELLGFPLSPAHRSQIAAIDLARGSRPLARRALIFSSQDRPSDAALAAALGDHGLDCERHVVADESGNDRDREGALLSSRILNAMADALLARKP